MTHHHVPAVVHWNAMVLLAAATLWCAACQQSEPAERTDAATAQPPAASQTPFASSRTPSVAAVDDAPLAASPASRHETVEGDDDVAPAGELIAQVDVSQTPAAAPAESDEQRPGPMLEGWQKPLLAIVLTGEQHGHLEPCGCSERQSGGLARRTDFVRQLNERGWPVTGFDLGGTLKRTRRQSEMKLDYTRNALNIMGYKGLGLGPEELRLGVLKLFESFSGTQADDAFDVPYVSANVTLFGTREVGTPLEYRVVDIAGVKVGVTSIIGESFQKELFPPGSEPDPSDLKIDPVDTVLPDVIRKMQAELGDDPQTPRVMILLSNAKPPESLQIAQKYPQFDLVVTAGSPEDPDGRTQTVGNTLLLKVGEKGKYAGLVGLYPGHKFRFATVELDRFRFGHAPQIDRLMEQYQQLLQDEDLVAREEPVRHDFGEEYTFLGSQKCGECHAEEFEIWKNTPHSHAFESLTVAYAQASDDPSLAQRVRVDRIHDPECINCHTTGWDPQDVVRFNGGFIGRDTTPNLMGVNCENCHGPGSQHVALEEAGAEEALLKIERAKLHLDVATAEAQVCIKCHDYENSPDFKFETYWPRIEH